MRNPNGYGGVKKLSGKRRKPFAAVVTTRYEIASNKQDISFLEQYISPELFERVTAEYNANFTEQIKAKQKQQVIGYYETRKDAMLALAEYNKNPFDLDKSKVTFAQIYEILKASEYSRRNSRYQTWIATAFNHCSPIHNMRMNDIKLSHLQDTISAYSASSKAVQQQMIVLIHAVYRYAMQHDIILKDYSKFVVVDSTAKAKEKTPFTREEIASIKKEIDWKHDVSTRCLVNAPMVDSVVILLYTGLRISELLALKKDDIHLQERWINVQGTKTKAAKRCVPIHKDIMPIMKKRYDSCNEHLFEADDGTQISYDQYRKYMKKFCKHFGFNHTAHEARHTFITIAASCQLNPILLKKIVGHAAADITQDVYTHAYIEDLVNEIDKFKI